MTLALTMVATWSPLKTLVAQGYGRNFYSDYRIVEVLPVDPDLGEGQDGVQDSFPPTMDMVLTAWMYDGPDRGADSRCASRALPRRDRRARCVLVTERLRKSVAGHPGSLFGVRPAMLVDLSAAIPTQNGEPRH